MAEINIIVILIQNKKEEYSKSIIAKYANYTLVDIITDFETTHNEIAWQKSL